MDAKQKNKLAQKIISERAGTHCGGGWLMWKALSCCSSDEVESIHTNLLTASVSIDTAKHLPRLWMITNRSFNEHKIDNGSGGFQPRICDLLRRVEVFVDLTTKQVSFGETVDSLPPMATGCTLLFVHGFNNTVQSAAYSALHTGSKMDVDEIIFFSWPSLGVLTGYFDDEAMVERSAEQLEQTLLEVRKCRPKLHILAHSLGNRLLMFALLRYDARLEAHNTDDDPSNDIQPLDQVFFAAADMDKNDFVTAMTVVNNSAVRFTNYASNGDRALAVSSYLHWAPRAGRHANRLARASASTATAYTAATFNPQQQQAAAAADFQSVLWWEEKRTLGHGYYRTARMAEDMGAAIANTPRLHLLAHPERPDTFDFVA